MATSEPAAAVITHAATAQPISDAITVASISPATYTVIAGAGQPNGSSDTALAGFPTHGPAFGILTTGNVNSADDPNNNGSTSSTTGQSSVRGTDTVFDLTVMRIDGLRGGPGCRLSFDYRFLSEEYPEYVGSNYNDVFVAELDQNSWTSNGGTVTAPNGFVMQSVNTSPMTVADAAGTTYDGASSLLTATVPFTQSTDRSLFLSIADLGDAGYDSAVFIDRLGVICGAHVTIHRFPDPTGTRLIASPQGWTCVDVNTNAVVTNGATLAQPDPGVDCTPPTNDAYCRRVVAGGYYAKSGTGSMSLTSACTGLSVTQPLQLPNIAGASSSATGVGLFPWRCQMNNGTISTDTDAWMFCQVNLP